MKNKILFIAPKIPYPAVDGHTKSMYGFIKSTYDLGYNVDLICYSQKKNVDEKLKQICNTYLIDVETENNFIEAIKNLFSEVPYNLSKYIRKDLIKFLENHLQTNSYEFVIIFNAHMGWIVNYLKSKTNSKIILREENLELLIMEKFYKNQKNLLIKFYAWLQYKKLLKYEPKLCEKFDACFMISDNDKIKLLLLNKNVNAVVINSSVEDELFNLTKNKIDKYSIFHIGSLNWYPNLDGLLWFLNEVFPKIILKEPRIKLYIYGSKLPQKYIVDEKTKHNIINVGFVENIWNELSDKLISIVPLRIGSGIRIKILELLAGGNIVVSTSIGAEGIGLTDNENIFIADDSDTFANQILKIVNDEINVTNFVESSKKYIYENYSWNKISAKIKSELSKLEPK
ncbi:MAG: glycosyltransferase family 4 protein [Melioribacteraceae bacterium]|nr:glycosyltransferase family 4 protein [Melioribacteraceae bacterium]